MVYFFVSLLRKGRGMSKAENTRKYIIEKSAPVFNIKGYSGTTLSDIVKATGLTKGAIYGNFENKDQVAIEVYKYNIIGVENILVQAMQDKKTASDKLIAFTDYYRNNWKTVFTRGGCPIQNASVEADDNAPFLKKYVQRSIKGWVKGISDIIELGQKEGTFKKKINAQEAAYSIVITLEGGLMLGKILNDPEVLFVALDRIVTLVKTELEK